MTVKESKELRRFEHEKKLRVDLLKQIEECSSNNRFAKLKSKGTRLATAPLLNLSSEHESEVVTLNKQITQAFLVKAEHLAAKKTVAKKEELPVVEKEKGLESHSSEPVPASPNEKYLAEVRKQLELMRQKTAYYKAEYERTQNEMYLDAYEAGQSLCAKIEGLTDSYAKKDIPLVQFKKIAKELLNEDSTDKDVIELRQHRGWKEILVNLLASIVGSVVYLAAAAYSGSLFVFKPETQGAKIAKTMGNVIQHVEEDEAEPDFIINGSSLGCHK